MCEKAGVVYDRARLWEEIMRSLQEISKLFDYNRWANGRTLDVARTLTPDEYGRALGGSFPSVADTLSHIYAAEWVWLERWEGRSPRALLAAQQVAVLAELRSLWRDVEDGQKRFLAALEPERLEEAITYQNVKGETRTYPLGEMLIHVVNHSTYHRGQVVTMIRQLGKKAMGTDYLQYLDSGSSRS
jgi:uncharacterized damage-inducible protein DinB